MFMISNGFTYIAFLMFVAGALLFLQKNAKWKIFDIVPPLVWIYVLHMIFCTVGLYALAETKPAYNGLKNNLLYAMIFVMLLRCDFKKLGPRIIAIDPGAYGAALALDTVCYSVWIALLLAVKFAPKWNKVCKADTSKLDSIADAAIVATAYNPNFAGIGVLMGVLGAAIGNLCGLAMGAILQIFV